MTDETTGGAMPRPSAMQGQVGRTGGPISGFGVRRDAEGGQSGANGGDAGAPPTGSNNPPAGAMPPAQATPPTPPATGDEGLGEAGKRAIQAERARAEAAEARVKELEGLTQSDQEKAVSEAKRASAAERDAHWKARIRAVEVRGALRGAGIVNDEFIEMALSHPKFRDLKVESETGAVEGLAPAVEAFRTSVPEAFAAAKPAPTQGGPWGGSEGGNKGKEPGSLTEAIEDHYAHPKR